MLPQHEHERSRVSRPLLLVEQRTEQRVPQVDPRVPREPTVDRPHVARLAQEAGNILFEQQHVGGCRDAKQIRVVAPGPAIAHLAAHKVLRGDLLRERRAGREQSHVDAAPEVDQLKAGGAVRLQHHQEVVRFYVGVYDLDVVKRLDHAQHFQGEVEAEDLLHALARFLFHQIRHVQQRAVGHELGDQYRRVGH